MTLGELGEAGLIRKIREKFTSPDLRASGVRVPIGDDAAIVELPPGQSLVLCSDLLVEDIHFLRDLQPPDSIGYKAVAVNVSDVGAMGGIPLYFMLSLAAPAELDCQWIEAFLDGVAKACKDFQVSLVGGDSSSSDRMCIDVSMTGSIAEGRQILRSGARAGDGIYLTGTVGSSNEGLLRLKAGDLTHPTVKRHLYPEPRHRVGRAVADRAHAMIDVSDGLSTDLAHIVEESKVSARIDFDKIPHAPGIPEQAILHGGEEYELIIVATDLPSTIHGVAITRIGDIIESALDHQIYLMKDASESILHPRGWQHFS